MNLQILTLRARSRFTRPRLAVYRHTPRALPMVHWLRRSRAA